MRGLVLFFTVIGLTVTGLPAVARADLPSSSKCSTDTTFCATAAIGVHAAGTDDLASFADAPVDLSGSFTNTSTDVSSNPDHWLQTLGISLANDGGVTIQSSDSQKDGRLIAGNGTSCGSGSDFSSCTAGSGSFSANVTNGPAFNGLYTGTFGIGQILNNNSSSNSNYLDWTIQAQFCLDFQGNSCFVKQPATFTVAEAAPPTPTKPLVLDLPATTNFTFSEWDVAASISALTINLPAYAPNDVAHAVALARLAPQCRTGALSFSATDAAGQSVAFSGTQPVTGCPKVSAKAHTSGRSVSLSATPTRGTDGKAVTSYAWAFGDGRSSTTTTPSVKHTYKNSASRTIHVVAIDAAGAQSSPATITLTGSRLTESAKPKKARAHHPVTLSGRLVKTGGHPIAHAWMTVGRVCSARRCSSKDVRTDAHGRWHTKVTVTAPSTYRAIYPGAGHVLGAQKSVKVNVG